jgi:hypothetical protein
VSGQEHLGPSFPAAQQDKTAGRTDLLRHHGKLTIRSYRTITGRLVKGVPGAGQEQASINHERLGQRSCRSKKRVPLEKRLLMEERVSCRPVEVQPYDV